MRISSELSKKAYLQAMKGSLESRFDFSNERLVGTVIGPFFLLPIVPDMNGIGKSRTRRTGP